MSLSSVPTTYGWVIGSGSGSALRVSEQAELSVAACRSPRASSATVLSTRRKRLKSSSTKKPSTPSSVRVSSPMRTGNATAASAFSAAAARRPASGSD